MHVKDHNIGYLIVLSKNWMRYRLNAFVERVCYDLDEAIRVRFSFESSDGMPFKIINAKTQEEV